MATNSRRCKSVNDDLIIELPAEVKGLILERLSIRDAARTALVSTQWKDVWLRHQQLVFDRNFYDKCVQKCEGNKLLAMVNIIDGILLRHVGSIKKFCLCVVDNQCVPQQSDIDRWCQSICRNGVENLSLYTIFSGREYDMPVCVVSCPTIKRLVVHYFIFDFPWMNGGAMLTGVTSLDLEGVTFTRKVVCTIPNVEKIEFQDCFELNNFKFSAPKLATVIVSCDGMVEDEWKWFTRYWGSIKTLCLTPDSCSQCFDARDELVPEMFPTSTTLQVLKLFHIDFASRNHFAVAMELIRKFPKIYELEILEREVEEDQLRDHEKENALRILEDPERFSLVQDLEMLHTVKIEQFSGSEMEMLFVKTLLSKTPALEKIIIMTSMFIDDSDALEITTELLCFPRASQKAQIVFLKYNFHSCPVKIRG